MKITNRCTLLSLLLIMLLSCSSYKNIPYLQDKADQTSDSLSATLKPVLFDAKIMPKDLLLIVVSSSEPGAAIPFNLITATAAGQTKSIASQPTLQTYLVNNNGFIDFPILGQLKIGGLTSTQIEKLLQQRLESYFKDEHPIITVRLINYKISVIGEVNRPSTFTIPNEKINILEALAQAGDLTIYGKRTNVKIIREDNQGQRQIILMDLSDKNLLNSPNFYLQQNDIVYVEPNKAKAQGSDIGAMTSILISATSIMISIASLLVTVLR